MDKALNNILQRAQKASNEIDHYLDLIDEAEAELEQLREQFAAGDKDFIDLELGLEDINKKITSYSMRVAAFNVRLQAHMHQYNLRKLMDDNHVEFDESNAIQNTLHSMESEPDEGNNQESTEASDILKKGFGQTGGV